MTDDLVTFLLARLDEDEEAARAADGEQWSNGEPTEWDGEVSRTVLRPHPGIGNYVVGSIRATHAEHIARHDPARVLAEVAAKRRLIERYTRAVAATPSVSSYVRGQDDGYRQACLDAIRDAAQIYAAHSDYRAEWALPTEESQ